MAKASLTRDDIEKMKQMEPYGANGDDKLTNATAATEN